MSERAAIWWIRRDLRLSDNAALVAAAKAGPVVPLYIHDIRGESLGAAPRWRLQEGLRALGAALEAAGSKLILRKGSAMDVLRDVLAETGGKSVHWMRLYDPVSREVDADVKATLRNEGYDAESYAGHLLHEPHVVKTKQGEFYKVYSPFYRAIEPLHVDGPLAAPRLSAPQVWPRSDDLEAWGMAADMRRGAAVLARYSVSGEAEAHRKLERFLDERAPDYKAARDRIGEDGTSELSEHLAFGEISPRQIWTAGRRVQGGGERGVEPFLKQIGWRDFAHHLLYHTPHMLRDNWREGWDSFPWSEVEDERVEAWKYGRTGIDFVDAAMREMWVTGRMHNRARMVVASYLTKHMMVHWRVGERWFADQLIDYDPANNAMGWQWVAGSGPDAAPYFRVFNPDTQLQKFDPQRLYVTKWLAEGQGDAPQTALDFYEAIEASKPYSPSDMRPAEPIVDLKEGRERALAAYSNR